MLFYLTFWIIFASLDLLKLVTAEPCARGNIHGTCLETRSNQCQNGASWVTSGLSQACPQSASDIECCLPENPIISDVATIYAAAEAYKDDILFKYITSQTADELVMGWLRHKAYDDTSWDLIDNFIPRTWLELGDFLGLPIPDTMPDPLFDGVNDHPQHLAATMNGVYVHGEQAWQSGIAGWAGDLFQFYDDWQQNKQHYPSNVESGYSYCKDWLFMSDGTSQFTIRDVEEDVDGFNIARFLRNNAGSRLDNVVKEYFSPPDGIATKKERFKMFFDALFAGKVETAIAEAEMVLTTDDFGIKTARNVIIKSATKPDTIDREQLHRFCECFGQTLEQLTLTGARPKPACSNDINTDPINCGRCWNVCQSGICSHGECQPKPTPLTEPPSWFFSAGEWNYYFDSPSLVKDKWPYFITVDDHLTANTKCVSVKDTAKDTLLPGDESVIPVKTGIMFQSGNDIFPYQCCLDWYSNSVCDSSSGKHAQKCGDFNLLTQGTDFEIRSWQISGCGPDVPKSE